MNVRDNARQGGTTSDYINLGTNLPWINNTVGTIAVWLKVNSLLGQGQNSVFFSTASTNWPSPVRLYFQVQGNKIAGEIGFNEGVGLVWLGSTALSTGIWYHAVFQYDGTSYRLFLNGQEETVTQSSGTVGPSSWFNGMNDGYPLGILLARTYAGTTIRDDIFTGIIDEARIYNRALSASDIESLYTDQTPSAPTGVSASAGNGQATISWSSVSGAASYNIYWSTSSGVTKTTGTKITGATSPYTHTGLTNSTTYYYVVTAVNSYGESSESSQVSAIPAKRFQVDTGSTLTTGLVAYYKLEDVNDFWSTNNLTNTGSVVFNAGKLNNAADSGADNTTAYRKLTNSNTLGVDGGVISISAWINITTTPSSGQDDAYIGQGNNTSKVAYQIDYCNDAGTLKLYFGRNKYAVIVDSAAYAITLTTGTWYHVVGTYDGTNVRLYLNNSLAGGPIASSGNGVNAYGEGVAIGANVSGNYGRGKVDEVGIWNKVLSTTEISELYNGGSGQTMQ